MASASHLAGVAAKASHCARNMAISPMMSVVDKLATVQGETR